MTVKEFSDSFDTLLNSYASKAMFGDQASSTEIVLDEYEKSVLLTQAQDNVLKSYFERHTNSLGQGFDDSSRRQVDFSSLIKVVDLTPVTDPSAQTFDHRGIIYKLPTVMADDGKDYSRVLYILNEALMGYTGSSTYNFIIGEGSTINTRQTISLDNKDNSILQIKIVSDPAASVSGNCTSVYTPASGSQYASLTITIGNNTTAADVESAVETALTDTSHSHSTISAEGTPAITMLKQQGVTLMPAGFVGNRANVTRFVIVPINYKEYDREMSKPYANPLKKQAWRLFQNISNGYDIYSELIPIWNVDTANLVYKIRYVERPLPIVLADLDSSLSVDGYNTIHGCDLNPIIHPEILHEAVRLAIESRASAVTRAEAYQRQAQDKQ